MALHADAIAKDRAAGVRTGGIDGDDANCFSLRAVMRGQPIDQRALARSRRACHADHKGVAGVREKFAAAVPRRADRGPQWR